MAKVVQFLVFVLLLTGCTSDTIRALERTTGCFKVARVFPVDLSSKEKQIFHIRGLEKPSILNRPSGGWTRYSVDLCVDSIPDGSLYYHVGMDLHTKVSIDGYVHEDGGGSPTGCRLVNDSDGWNLVSNSFPAETDLDKTLTIEFQVNGGDDWLVTAKSHKLTPSGETPVIEYHLNRNDSASLSLLKNPRIVIWTGD